MQILLVCLLVGSVVGQPQSYDDLTPEQKHEVIGQPRYTNPSFDRSALIKPPLWISTTRVSNRLTLSFSSFFPLPHPPPR